MRHKHRRVARTLHAARMLAGSAFMEWRREKIARQAAALAYYAIFSLVPLLLIVLTLAGELFGPAVAEQRLHDQVEELVGSESARVVVTLIGGLQVIRLDRAGLVVGVTLLLWGASQVFYQLKDVLNTIWQVEPQPGRGWRRQLAARGLSLLLVFGLGVLLLLSLVLVGAVSAVKPVLAQSLAGLPYVTTVKAINVLLGFALNALLFAALYKLLPDAQIAWRDVWVGATTTGMLFTLGQYLLGLYLSQSVIGSAFGSPGALMIVLVWIYWCTQLVCFGAELTCVYANRYGSRILPAAGAQATRSAPGAARARIGPDGRGYSGSAAGDAGVATDGVPWMASALNRGCVGRSSRGSGRR